MAPVSEASRRENPKMIKKSISEQKKEARKILGIPPVTEERIPEPEARAAEVSPNKERVPAPPAVEEDDKEKMTVPTSTSPENLQEKKTSEAIKKVPEPVAAAE